MSASRVGEGRKIERSSAIGNRHRAKALRAIGESNGTDSQWRWGDGGGKDERIGIIRLRGIQGCQSIGAQVEEEDTVVV